jgi:Pin2-interacting protein X1
LAHDPNNTKWTGNTESFGAKLMAAQGWQPGDFLGAKDARQAEHYTAASASHIRVIIKDDNLGLGAKIGSGVGHGECTGLDAFKDLLGRLNGRDEDELEKEKKSREDLKRAIYSERKWGSTRFVRGGFLIGDKIQPLIEAEAERVRNLAKGPLDTAGTSPSDSSSSSESDEETPAVEKPKKSKKRKLEDHESVQEVVAVKVKKSKRDRKSEARLEEVGATEDSVQSVKESKKKSKKDRHSEVDDDTIEEERRRRKKEKKEKKARREEERLRSHDREDSAKVHEKLKRKSGRPSMAESSESRSRITTKESTSSTPVPSSGYSTPMMQGRHAVRSRNIAQKRLASMDIASLNQVSPPCPYPYTCISCQLTPHRSS